VTSPGGSAGEEPVRATVAIGLPSGEREPIIAALHAAGYPTVTIESQADLPSLATTGLTFAAAVLELLV